MVPIEDHPWGRWAEFLTANPDRVPGTQSRWSQGKDLSFTPLRPERVVEVAYDHMEGRRFRHTAQFRRWRTDRDPESCGYEQLEEVVSYDLASILGVDEGADATDERLLRRGAAGRAGVERAGRRSRCARCTRASTTPSTYHVLLPLEDAAARIEASMGTLAGGEMLGYPTVGRCNEVDVDAVRKDCEERSNARPDRDARRAARRGRHGRRQGHRRRRRSTRWPRRSRPSTAARRSS